MPKNKYPEETRELILETSLRLFVEKGYSEVRIQDIVDNLKGLTKGAIYHHFKNKEDIFDALYDRNYKSVNSLNYIVNESSSGLDKLKKLIKSSLRANIDNINILHIPDGLLNTPRFLHRQIEINQTVLTPIIKKLIEEGNEDKSLVVPYSEATAECFALLTNIWMNPAVYPSDKETYLKKILAYKKVLDSLGLPVIDDDILSLFSSLVKGSDGK